MTQTKPFNPAVANYLRESCYFRLADWAEAYGYEDEPDLEAACLRFIKADV